MNKEAVDAEPARIANAWVTASLPRKEPLVAESTSTVLATLMVIAAISYMADLCFIHTHLFPISRGLVGAAEFAILFACLPILLNRLPPPLLVLMAFIGANLCMLSLIRGRVDFKSMLDLLIPLWFFWLGCNIGNTTMADGLLKRLIILVLVFALFELFFLHAYTRVFNVFSYYVSIGHLQPITDYARDSRLQLNGLRTKGMGRTLLPSLLGNHRISSVFLEPISLGNFASIVAAWGLSKDRAEWKTGVLFVLAAVLFIILADSRFGVGCVALMVVMRLVLRGRWHALAMLFPFLVVAVLVVLGMEVTGPVGDNYLGRLAVSGRALVGFDAARLLGIAPDESFPDQGYAYVLSTFGILIATVLWTALWILQTPDDRSQRFRAFLALYTALVLCISGTAFFSLKTAGVLWFLLGCSLNGGRAAAIWQQTQKSRPHIMSALMPGHRRNKAGAIDRQSSRGGLGEAQWW